MLDLTLVIDPSSGTHVIGSKNGILETTYREHYGDNFSHSVTAKIVYKNDWILAITDEEIQRYYATILKTRFGIQLDWKSKWNSHVSVIRGDEPLKNKHLWEYHDGQDIAIKYTHDIYTNGSHWWLNVQSKELDAIREFYGLEPKSRSLHLTIGRISSK